MSSVLQLMQRGGMPLVAIVCLSLLLYQRCTAAILYFWGVYRKIKYIPVGTQKGDRLKRLQEELDQTYQRHRVTISTMIAAGPLLGLLGTVSGMIRTFESLAQQTGQKTVEGLAGGISEALISTEAGLGVAIPGVLALYYAHRLAQKGVERLRHLEAESMEGATPC
jgi:flagellar motor component MotA